MHTALAIPELLEPIFGHLDKASNAKNILVCRKWYDIGRRVLWHDVDGRQDFHRLVKILGPLGYIEPEESDDMDFDSYPEVDDWARFEKYAKLVRTMSLRNLLGYKDILSTLAEARPMFNMFPNVHTLEYSMVDSPVTSCILFMHPTVVRFKVTIPVPSLPQPSLISELPFVMEAIPRMAMLTHLNINASLDMFADLLGRTLDAICGLTSLRSVRFPRYTMTANVFEKLAHLPHLEELETQEEKQITSKGSVPLKPILPPGSFRALRAVTVSTDLSSARQFLINHAFVSKIRRLSLELDDFDAGSLPSLLKAVSQTCKALQKLLINQRAFLVDAIPFPLPSFTLDALTPVLSCPHLTSLEIHHYTCSPDFTEADLDALAAQVPKIESLVLSTSSSYAPSKLTLRALPLLAARCPRLKTLGLYLDAADATFFASQAGLPPPPEFPALERLELWNSRVGNDAHAVALFLAQVCPPGCELEASTFDILSDTWKHVRVLLPGLVKMRVVTTRRVEERLRARAGVVAKT